MVRPPSSSKQTDNQNHPAGQILQGTKRQRTNTTLGLQSNKHGSMRQSTNNLTLQDLMASQTTVSSHLHNKPGTKPTSNRGNTTEKTPATANFTHGSVSNFKSNSLIKPNPTAAASKKNTNFLYGNNPASRSNGISQIKDRVELMSAKATATGV